MLPRSVVMSACRLRSPLAAPILQSFWAACTNGGGPRGMSSTPLQPAVFYQAVRDSGVEFFCGVPDSLLKDFCAYVTQTVPDQDHFITANEGNAVAMCTGYHLATGKTGLVYLQNSGLGNLVNPLMSLADPAVSSIPILLLIGWRGEPGVKDEPQHMTQGRITESMLQTMEIPSHVLPQDEGEMRKVLEKAKHHFKEKKAPFALLVKTKTFSPCSLPPDTPQYPLRREEAMVKVVNCMSDEAAIVSSTGMLSRELFEHRVQSQTGHHREFLTVGAMGHASCIALTIALNKPNKQVFALDGDGAVLMHMGSMATIGQRGPANFHHVVFNNGAHDSVGGQPTEAASYDNFSITDIALACGYRDQRPCSLASITIAAGRSTHCPGTLASITAAAGWSTQRCPWTLALIINIAAVS
ncbi:hypothetical protein ACOMHN_030348 [Nucella lapillus]